MNRGIFSSPIHPPLPRFIDGVRPIAYLYDADMTLDTDQAFTFVMSPVVAYIITKVTAYRKTGAYNTACAGGIYTSASKAGTAVVAAGQSYAGLTGAGKLQDCTVAAVNGTDVNTASTLFLSLTTGNGAALTADIYVWGHLLNRA